jgi:hypothetical protein
MRYYYVDLFGSCVTAEITDTQKLEGLIRHLGPQYGVIETETALVAKPLPEPGGPEPRGVLVGYPIYGSLDNAGVAYTPLVVADVFTDYDFTPTEVHHDASRFALTTDVDGYVRAVNPVWNPPA